MSVQTQDKRSTLYAKLARVMGQIGELEKKGRNQSFNYSFIRDVDVANALRPLLSEQGVAMLVGMENVDQQPIQSGSGSTGYHTVARLSITFADGETGATVTVPWFGEANDYQDKGINKAATLGLKYALLKTFLIGSDDDPDAEAIGAQSAGASDSAVEVDLNTTVNFGKHNGKTLGEILEEEPGYVEWLAKNWKWDKGRAMAEALTTEELKAEAPNGGNGRSQPAGARDATDFWTLAKQMINNRSGFDSETANAIKAKHQGPDGVDWDAAYTEMEGWTAPEEEDVPF